MMAAAVAAGHRNRVTLLEKGPRLGRKLLLTGNGRCNLTNNVPPHRFIDDCGPGAKFLHNALGRFSNADAVEYFSARGVPLQLEQGGRYFPRSGGAAAVLQALESELATHGVTLVTGTPVTRIRREGGGYAIAAGADEYHAKRLIIATGGKSFPQTGSSGDGYDLARTLGHAIIEPRPGNVPLLAAERWLPQLQGVSIAHAVIGFTPGGERHIFPGGLMFTQYGISGPAAFDASRALADASETAAVAAGIDLMPGLPADRLDHQLVSAAARHGRKSLRGLVAQLLPERLAVVVVRLAGGDPEQPASQLSAGRRQAIVAAIKCCPVTITGTRGFDEAMVTIGGVAPRDLDPATMESRLAPGLYFCGEVLDLDGPCGGYNLQIAWTTGFTAGFAAGSATRHASGNST